MDPGVRESAEQAEEAAFQGFSNYGKYTKTDSSTVADEGMVQNGQSLGHIEQAGQEFRKTQDTIK